MISIINHVSSLWPIDTSSTNISNDLVMYGKIDRMSPEIIDYLISKGPMQPTAEHLLNNTFPKDKFGRCFQTSWYWKLLPVNVNIPRDWLSYSLSSDKIFCHHCLLFGHNIKKAWTRDGFSAWSRALISMQVHECSEAHIEASLKFKLKKTSLPLLPLLAEKK